jgi:alpha-L-fucosidase
LINKKINQMRFRLFFLYALMIAFATLFSSCGENDGKYYIQSAEIPKDFSFEEKVDLSAHVLPHTRQMKWFNDEFLGFIHYGPNTYSGREWGTGTEDAALFQPGNLNTDQWCRLMEEAGIRRVIMVAKHHDGYCLWQTRYTNHSVAASPWRNGKGDVLRELIKSAKKYGLRVGVYLSPADLYQIESEDGCYGNGSPFTQREIPGKVEGRPFVDNRTFTYKVDDYNEYFLNQLFELLTEYGPIYEVWFDGANPKPGTGQTYNYDAWFDLIRNLAPDAVIFGKGPDARWCGNEGGATREAEYNVVPLPVSPEEFNWPDMTDSDVAGRDKITAVTSYFHYYPAETNTSIRNGWFWRNDDEQQVRSADDVFDIYERSVGGNSVFLLNIPPNQDGQFSPRDAKVLKKVGARINAVYGTYLPFDKETTEKCVTDQDPSTWWSPASENDALEIKLAKTVPVNRFIIQEAIEERGERVEAHTLEAKVDEKWVKIAEGKTIGHKRILRFPVVETDAFRLSVLKSRAAPCIAEVSAHYYNEHPRPVVITRNSSGKVIMGIGTGFSWRRNNNDAIDLSQPVYYTLDGTDPTISSMSYEQPLDLPQGGHIKAKAIVEGREGPVSEKYIGILKEEWTVTVASGNEKEAAKAVDGKPYSAWITEKKQDAELVIYMNGTRNIGGFIYFPAPGANGYIESWMLEISKDGKLWKKIKEGSFGNIVNDPSQRIVLFDTSFSGSYLRFSRLKAPGRDNKIGIAELEILPEGINN